MSLRPIRVLVIDDSPIVRDVLKEGLSKDQQIEVVGTAVDPYMAREKIAQLKPDVLTLDIEMPRMDGIQFLKFLMPQYPLPVIVVSALTTKGAQATIQALEVGAIDFITKPGMTSAVGVEKMLEDLVSKLKICAYADVSHWKKRAKKPEISHTPVSFAKLNQMIVAIGASTGGVNAVTEILTRLPKEFPGVLVVQHMPPGFTKSYADRLDSICRLDVKEAENGDAVFAGRVLIAPGEQHLVLRSSRSGYYVNCEAGQKIKGHCPSVDVLFQSVAKFAGPKSVGVILTGMGSDGSGGLLEMKNSGARTIAQDRQSSVVFGMPQEAYKIGAAEQLVSLFKIPNKLLEIIRQEHS